MVHPLSHQIPRVRCYSGFCLPTRNFVYRTLTFFGLSSHTVLLSLIVDYAVLTPYGLLLTVWPRPISLAATLGISFWFLFLCLLRCFSSAGSPCISILFNIQCYSIAVTRFRIRTSMDLCSFAAPHSFSQLVASFFGSWCQGIHLTLLFAWTSCILFPILWFSLNCLSFFEHWFVQDYWLSFAWKDFFFAFCTCFWVALSRVPPFGEIVFSLFVWKD